MTAFFPVLWYISKKMSRAAIANDAFGSTTMTDRSSHIVIFRQYITGGQSTLLHLTAAESDVSCCTALHQIGVLADRGERLESRNTHRPDIGRAYPEASSLGVLDRCEYPPTMA